jgi:hypothetical protein
VLLSQDEGLHEVNFLFLRVFVQIGVVVLLPIQADLFQIYLLADLRAIVLDLHEFLLVFAVYRQSVQAFNAKSKRKGYVIERGLVFAVFEDVRPTEGGNFDFVVVVFNADVDVVDL